MCRTSRFVFRSVITTAALFMSSVAWAVGPQVIFTKIAGHPSSIVPGALDLSGNPAVANFQSFNGLYMSPDGSRWLVYARTDQGSALHSIALMGSGTSGTMFLQGGQPVPDGQPGELIDVFGTSDLDPNIGRFNDNNQFALSLRAREGSASIRQKVIVWDGVNFDIAIQMGDLYTGLIDLPGHPSGDETVGDSIGSVHLLNDMTVGSRDSSILQIDFSRRPGLAYNHAAFKQTGVSTFLSLDGQSNHVLGLSVPTFNTTPDGQHWLVRGTILGAPTTSDSVVVFDGQVMLQEDSPVGSSSAVVRTIDDAVLLSNGDWFSRGVRDPNLASWAARNGVLLAQTGDPVVTPLTGPAELWGGNFLAVTGNRNGDWILVGRTDNPDITRDDVVVLNGIEILVREGDPIDLNGNGLYDDNVYIGRGNNVSAAFATDRYFALTDEGVLYFFANLRNGQGQDLSPGIGPPLALLRLNTLPCVGDISADGQINIVDLLAVISNWGQTGTNPADVNGDNIVNITDLLAVIAGWGACQ